MRNFSPVFTAVVFGLNASAAVDTTKNLFSCATDNVFQCRLMDGVIDHHIYPVKVKLEVDYTYQCGSIGNQVDYYFAIDSVSDGVRASFQWQDEPPGTFRKILLVSGRGPFHIVDTDPNWTRSNPAEVGCTFSIHGIRRDLSPEALDYAAEKVSHAEMLHAAHLHLLNQTTLVTMLKGLVKKADIVTVQGVLPGMRDTLESTIRSLGREEDTAWIMMQALIDSAIALNPSLDPNSTIGAELDAILTQFSEVLRELSFDVGGALAQSIAGAAEILSFGADATVEPMKARLRELEK